MVVQLMSINLQPWACGSFPWQVTTLPIISSPWSWSWFVSTGIYQFGLSYGRTHECRLIDQNAMLVHDWWCKQWITVLWTLNLLVYGSAFKYPTGMCVSWFPFLFLNGCYMSKCTWWISSGTMFWWGCHPAGALDFAPTRCCEGKSTKPSRGLKYVHHCEWWRPSGKTVKEHEVPRAISTPKLRNPLPLTLKETLVDFGIYTF